MYCVFFFNTIRLNYRHSRTAQVHKSVMSRMRHLGVSEDEECLLPSRWESRPKNNNHVMSNYLCRRRTAQGPTIQIPGVRATSNRNSCKITILVKPDCPTTRIVDRNMRCYFSGKAVLSSSPYSSPGDFRPPSTSAISTPTCDGQKPAGLALPA